MSAPLTPEQRKTQEDNAAILLAISVIYPHWRDACLAGERALRAALSQPARTCGTCDWVKPANGPWGQTFMCGNKAAPAYVAGHVKPDDGCLKGWRARETETPTP